LRLLLATKERKKLTPKSMDFFTNGNNFISSGFKVALISTKDSFACL